MRVHTLKVRLAELVALRGSAASLGVSPGELVTATKCAIMLVQAGLTVKDLEELATLAAEGRLAGNGRGRH